MGRNKYKLVFPLKIINVFLNQFYYLETNMIYKKPNSKYWYTKFEMEYQGLKKRVHKSTRHTSKAKAASFEAQLKQDFWLSMTTRQIEQHSLKEAIELHLLSRQVNRSLLDKKRKLLWWCKQLKNPALSELSTPLILSEISKKVDISIATRNRYLAELKSLLNFCHKELGWIDKVPVLNIIKEPKRAFFKLSPLDVKNLLKASPDYLQPIIAFALLTGLRRGNILNLRWAQVDFERGCLFIEANEHKSKDHVTTPLCLQAIDVLVHLKSKSTSSYVFTTCTNIPLNEIQHRVWSQATIEANVEGLRFHDLRHNWATKHIEAGTDLLALKELGGWKTLEMVQRYAHPSNGYLSQQAKNIDSRTHFPSISSLKSDVTSNLDKLIHDEKSSHFDIIERKNENLKIVGERYMLENLMIFKRLLTKEGAQLKDKYNNEQRILNPSCIPISPHRQSFNTT